MTRRGDDDLMDFLKSTIGGWQLEQPTANFGGWQVGEEVIQVSEALPWREDELHSAPEMTMTGRELEEDHRFGAWEIEER